MSILSWLAAKFSRFHLDYIEAEKIIKTLDANTRDLNLNRLKLSSDQVNSLLMNLDQHDNLEKLNISGCSLFSFPTNVLNLVHLKELNISINCIRKIPAEIRNLSYLTSLDISGNMLHELPTDIGYLKYLRELCIGGNPCISELPKMKEDIALFYIVNHTVNIIYNNQNSGDI